MQLDTQIEQDETISKDIESLNVNGTVKFQVSRESDEEGSGSFVFTEENKEEYQNGEMEENE